MRPWRCLRALRPNLKHWDGLEEAGRQRRSAAAIKLPQGGRTFGKQV